jgi:hypothetical protein
MSEHRFESFPVCNKHTALPYPAIRQGYLRRADNGLSSQSRGSLMSLGLETSCAKEWTKILNFGIESSRDASSYPKNIQELLLLGRTFVFV